MQADRGIDRQTRMVSALIPRGPGYTIEAALQMGLVASLAGRWWAFRGTAGDLPLVPESTRPRATGVVAALGSYCNCSIVMYQLYGAGPGPLEE